MKPIAIIGAMREEIEALQAKIEQPQRCTIAGLEIHTGTLYGKPVVMVMSGIGKVNMAMCTQLLIDRFDVGALINPGCAGGLGEAKVGDIVISTQSVERDFDCSDCGDAVGVIPRMDRSTFIADKRLVELAANAARELYPEISVYTAPVTTGDQFLTDRKYSTWLHEHFGAMASEMEGAAMAHVAYLNGDLPYVIIRAISDTADGDANETYQKHKDAVLRRNVDSVCRGVKEL